MALLAFHFPAICLFSFRRRGPRLEVSALWFPCSAHHTARAHQRERENPMCVCMPSHQQHRICQALGKKLHVLFLQHKMPLHITVFYYTFSGIFSIFYAIKTTHIHLPQQLNNFLPWESPGMQVGSVYKCARVIKLNINRGEHKIKMLQLVAASQNNARAHTGGPRGKIKCIWQWSGSSPDCEAAAALLFSNRCTCLAASHATDRRMHARPQLCTW